MPGAAAMAITALLHPRYRSRRHRLPVRQSTPETGKGKGQAEKGHGQKSEARIKVNRGDLPVIKLGNARLSFRAAGVVKRGSVHP